MSFKYDASGIEENGAYLVAPAGDYTLEIIETQEKVTKENNYPMVSCRCEITRGECEGCTVWHNVTFLPPEKRGAGMAIQFLKHIGEPYEGNFVVNAEAWVGKLIQAKLTVGKSNTGKPRNEIAYLLDKTEVPVVAEDDPFADS